MTVWQVRRFFINSIWRQRSRTSVAFIMVAISVMFSLILTSLTVGIDQTVRSIVGAQFALDTIQASPSMDGQPLNLAALDSIRALPAVASAEPYFTFLSRATMGNHRVQINVMSIAASAPEVQRLALRTGRTLQPDDRAAVVLNERTIRAMGMLDPDAALNQPLTMILRRGAPPLIQSIAEPSDQPASGDGQNPRLASEDAIVGMKPGAVLPTTPAPGAAGTEASSTTLPNPQLQATPTNAPVPATQTAAPPTDEVTRVYTATIVGVAKYTVNDRVYLSPELGLDMASWQSYKDATQLIEQTGYNGIQVVAQRVEDVRNIQRELAVLQLSTESPLDSATQAQAIVERVQIGLVGVLLLTLALALMLIYGSIWTTIRARAPQIGTLLLVGAPPRQVRAVLSSVAFAVILPGALLGLTLGLLFIMVANYVWQARMPGAADVVLVLPLWMPLVAVLVALGLGWLIAFLVGQQLRQRSIAELLWHKKE